MNAELLRGTTTLRSWQSWCWDVNTQKNLEREHSISRGSWLTRALPRFMRCSFRRTSNPTDRGTVALWATWWRISDAWRSALTMGKFRTSREAWISVTRGPITRIPLTRVGVGKSMVRQTKQQWHRRWWGRSQPVASRKPMKNHIQESKWPAWWDQSSASEELPMSIGLKDLPGNFAILLASRQASIFVTRFYLKLIQGPWWFLTIYYHILSIQLIQRFISIFGIPIVWRIILSFCWFNLVYNTCMYTIFNINDESLWQGSQVVHPAPVRPVLPLQTSDQPHHQCSRAWGNWGSYGTSFRSVWYQI